jgi:hypothetical protein
MKASAMKMPGYEMPISRHKRGAGQGTVSVPQLAPAGLTRLRI